MRKADRLFRLTNLIRVKQPITADDIAHELGVSVRSVYRYIDDLSVSGIPIYGTKGVGYQLHESYELPPLNLTEKEIDALVLGIKMVSTWTGDSLSEGARSLANKIESVLPMQVRNEHFPVVYAPDLSIRESEREIWGQCYEAIKNKCVLEIRYRAPDGNLTDRKIFPLGLFYWGGKWTLACWCSLRKDYRDFRLDRIMENIVTKKTYETTDVVNLEAALHRLKKAHVS
ncbi:helix-turn-helix transcriptional regulator [Marinomonas epiphytica]